MTTQERGIAIALAVAIVVVLVIGSVLLLTSPRPQTVTRPVGIATGASLPVTSTAHPSDAPNPTDTPTATPTHPPTETRRPTRTAEPTLTSSPTRVLAPSPTATSTPTPTPLLQPTLAVQPTRPPATAANPVPSVYCGTPNGEPTNGKLGANWSIVDFRDIPGTGDAIATLLVIPSGGDDCYRFSVNGKDSDRLPVEFVVRKCATSVVTLVVTSRDGQRWQQDFLVPVTGGQGFSCK